MATRLYLPASAASTPITPTPDAAWEDTSILARAMTSTATIADPMATVAFDDANATNRDVLFRQYISLPLTAGQTITGAQAIKAQARVSETDVANNMFLAVGIRIINGTTVQKTVLAVTRDGTEATTSLTNRQFTATSAATDYTTVADDRIVIEVGMGGDPSLSDRSHDSSIRFGDAAAADLAEDDTSTTDDNPWIELTDTLTFGASFDAATVAAMQPLYNPVLDEPVMIPY